MDEISIISLRIEDSAMKTSPLAASRRRYWQLEEERSVDHKRVLLIMLLMSFVFLFDYIPLLRYMGG